jgi:hypothetical protein
MSLMIPDPTKIAQASTAEARISGEDSVENAGVKAAVMGA